MKRLALLAAVAWFGCSPGNHPPSGGGGGGTGGAGGGGTSAVDPAKSTVTVDPAGPVVADGNAMAHVTVTVLDADGKAVGLAPVTVTLSGSGANVTQAPSTDPQGVTSVAVSSQVAETKTVTVTAGATPVTLDAHPAITFIAGPPAGVHFDVQPPASVKAGEVISPPVHLVVTDLNGNLAPTPPIGVQLRLVYSSSGVLTGGSAIDSVDGGLTFDMLKVDRAQTGYALRAEVLTGAATGSADESQKFDVVVGDVSQVTSTLVASPVNLVADGATTTTLTVTLEDLGTNPVSGQAISLSVSGTGNTLGASSGTSDAAGTFSTTLSSTVAETKTITATAGAVQLTTQVTFIP